MTPLSVAIATFGSRATWEPLAARAVASVEAQTVPVEIVRHHLDDPHPTVCGRARNEAIRRSSGEWVAVLDADDEWAPDFAEQVLESIAAHPDKIHAPAMSYFRNGKWDEPKMGIRRPIHKGCWVVVGGVIRRDDFDRIGGFREDLEWGEDVALWLAAERAGLAFVEVPAAVYRIHWRDRSRKDHPQSNVLWNRMVMGRL